VRQRDGSRMFGARWGGASAALVCIGSASSPAKAQPPPPLPHIGVQLAYVRAAGTEKICPDEAHLRRSLRADFGYDPTLPTSSSRLTIVVTQGPGNTVHGTMELRDADGNVGWKGSHRALYNDCLTLINGIALSVRIGIEKVAPPRDPLPSPSPPAASLPAPAPPEPDVPEPSPPEPSLAAPIAAATNPPPRPAPPKKSLASGPAPAPSEPSRRPKVRAGVDAAFSLGSAPVPAVGLAIQAGVRWPNLSVSLEGRGDLPAGRGEDGEEFTTGRIGGSVVPCGHVGVFVGCLLGTVGRQYASNSAKDVSDWYGGGGVRAGIEVPVAGSVSLRFMGDLVGTVPLVVRVDSHERWDSMVTATISGGAVADF
jgi:hypothetical protein